MSSARIEDEDGVVVPTVRVEVLCTGDGLLSTYKQKHFQDSVTKLFNQKGNKSKLMQIDFWSHKY